MLTIIIVKIKLYISYIELKIVKYILIKLNIVISS